MLHFRVKTIGLLSCLLLWTMVVLLLLLGSVAARPASSGSETPEVMCRLPEMRGHCRALISRWRYDPTTGKCYEFGFGGCDGNGNNFPSRKACIDMCSGIR